MSEPSVARPYVFISYASPNRAAVLRISAALREAGVEVWLDRSDIQGGANYGTVIADAIEHCTAFMLMCSAAALVSRNVKQEIQLAWRFQKAYLPLLLERVEIPKNLVYWLEGHQWIEVLDRPAAMWLPDVLQALQRMDDGTDLPELSLASAPKPPSAPNNLPNALSGFVGREQECQDVQSLLLAGRLVTLTGPGGTGKTRLAIETAHGVLSHFTDGVWLVELAPITDPQLVVGSITQVLGVKEVAGLPLSETLKAYLRERSLLLVLDNFERLVDAAAFIQELLTACPSIRVLATSRVRLHIPGEREYAVPPLPVPLDRALSDVNEVRAYAGVELFVQRAQETRLGFALTADNVAAVAEVCRRLEGLPLALELAAARVKILTPQALLARMESRLKLLTGGSRTLPQRQQTLRDTIVWSYDLLEPDEQTLFRRLAVFAGGCTLEAVEAVVSAVGDLSLDILDGITALVDKSLLRLGDGSDGEPRATMLETIREFALEALVASGEEPRLRRRHAEYVIALAEASAPGLESADRPKWIRQLSAEQDNVRAALGWAVEAKLGAIGCRIVGPLNWFYYLTGAVEGRRWAEAVLAVTDTDADPAAHAATLHTAGFMAWQLGDMPVAIARFHESVALWRELAQTMPAARRGLARALAALSLSHRTDPITGRVFATEAVATARVAQTAWVLCYSLALLGIVCAYAGDGEAAQSASEESYTLARALADPLLLSLPTMVLGMVSLVRNDLENAQRRFDESLATFQAAGDQWSISQLMLASAWTTQQRGLDGRGGFLETVMFCRERGIKDTLANSFQGLAAVAQREGQSHRAARLAGAAHALLETNHAITNPLFQPFYEPMIAEVEAGLGEKAFREAWLAGEALNEEHAVALALQ